MAHDYKAEIRAWYMDDRLDRDISEDDLFTALDADPDYWERRNAFHRAILEMIESGEFDTYAGRLQFNALSPADESEETP